MAHLAGAQARRVRVTTAAGILMFAVGAAFPLGMLIWLSSRLQRQPAPRPRQVGMWLALNFMLPAGLVLQGLSLISTRFSSAAIVRYATAAALVGAFLLLIGLAVDAVMSRRPGGDDGQ
jgi:hypothetical protein